VVPVAAAFIALDDTTLANYCIYATRVLEQKVIWAGYAATGTQALGWPRKYAEDKYGMSVPSDEVPPQVIAVTCELARWLQDNDPADGQDVANLKQITVDVVDVVFQDPTSQTSYPTIFNQIIAGLGQLQIGGRGFKRVVKA
jgi:energy-coupling factor transporter ATP-binding protein EcfA2